LILAGLSLLLLGSATWLLDYLVHPRLVQIGVWLAALFAAALALPLLFLALQFLTVALTALAERNCLLMARGRPIVMVILMPIAVSLGKLIGIQKERIERSFLAVNNALVQALYRRIAPTSRGILVLLPSCLQFLKCQQKVVEDIANCKGCGRCDIANLIPIKERYRLALTVATGGSVARNIVKALRPAGIIAVACERELVTGISELTHIPVIGLPNERPEGPCKNTRINPGLVEKAVVGLLGG
jgi:hypothetical protein